MPHSRSLRIALGLLLLAAAATTQTRSAAAQQAPVIVPGSRVAIVGDSITEQKLYSKYIEAYLVACSGVPDVKVFQFGWSGETASGFNARLKNDLNVFRPTVVTLCYGMNDGGYQPWNEQIGTNYETNMRKVLAQLKELSVRSVVVGSPGAVDFRFFRPGQKMGDRPAFEAYNDNLAHLRDIDQRLATEQSQRFANVHDAMIEAMKKAQAALGEGYHVCGGDGFHPAPNGQLVMAYAFLKGMGLDGQIGEITLDMQGEATASAGHKVASGTNGTAEIVSSRWPFCFDGDDKNPAGTRSIVPFLPFNQELNRLVLKVKNLNDAKAKVTWGDQSKDFTQEQLAAGINLTEEFSQTPFDPAFQKFVDALGQKQNFETMMIKQLITNFRAVPPALLDAEMETALRTVGQKMLAHQQTLEAASRSAFVPVTHKLTVTAAQ